MEIKNGYNGKPTTLKFSVNGKSVELWIEQTGVKDSKETLSYLTPTELVELYGEIQKAGEKLFNLSALN